jgi:hypothetical protein
MVELMLGAGQYRGGGLDNKLYIWFGRIDVWLNCGMLSNSLKMWEEIGFQNEASVICDALADRRLQFFVCRTDRKDIDGEDSDKDAGQRINPVSGLATRFLNGGKKQDEDVDMSRDIP